MSASSPTQPPAPPPPLLDGVGRDRLVRALAALLYEREHQQERLDALRRIR